MAASDTDDSEDIHEITFVEASADPHWNARIRVVRNGRGHFGQVEAIDIGLISREKLYRITYEDGDREHFTLEQLSNVLVATIPGQ